MPDYQPDPSQAQTPQFGDDPDAIARRRKLAQALQLQGLNYSPVQSYTQGLARLADSLVGTLGVNRADREEEASRARLDAALAKGGSLSDVGKALVGAGGYGRQAGEALLLKDIEEQNAPPSREYKTLKGVGGAESLIGITTPRTGEPTITQYPLGGAASGGPQPTTVGDVALDRKYGPDLLQWSQGGAAEFDSSLKSLDYAINELKTKKDAISGPLIGAAVRQDPASVLGIAAASKYPEAIDTSQRHQRAVIASMRAILGAQRGEKLYEMVINSTYNPSQPWQVNANRLQILRDNLAKAAKAKQAAAEYFSKNGTLKGFSGRVPDESDLTSGLDSSAAPAGSQPAGSPLPPRTSGGMIPPQAVRDLQNHPELRQQFESKYGVSADAFLR